MSLSSDISVKNKKKKQILLGKFPPTFRKLSTIFSSFFFFFRLFGSGDVVVYSPAHSETIEFP